MAANILHVDDESFKPFQLPDGRAKGELVQFPVTSIVALKLHVDPIRSAVLDCVFDVKLASFHAAMSAFL